MAIKNSSITDQILQLESDLQSSRERIKLYEKAIDKACKIVFGKSVKEIEKIIEKSETDESFRMEKNYRGKSGVDTDIDEGNVASEGQRPSAI